MNILSGKDCLQAINTANKNHISQSCNIIHLGSISGWTIPLFYLYGLAVFEKHQVMFHKLISVFWTRDYYQFTLYKYLHIKN